MRKYQTLEGLLTNNHIRIGKQHREAAPNKRVNKLT